MANMKELIIGQMTNGKETLNDIDVSRKNGPDYRIGSGKVDNIIDRYHPDFLYLRVSEIIELNKDCKTFRLVSRKSALPTFQSGQYVNMFVNIDGILTSRPYSISSSNKQIGYIDITIQRIKNGFVSNYFLDKVKVNDEFTAKGPDGTFHYNPVFHSKKSVFIAGGSGITPFMSMSREVLESGLDREITLIYGCRNLDNILFYEELKSMEENHPNFTLKIVLSEPSDDYKGLTGFINKDILKDGLGDLNDYTYYICGPEIMNAFVTNELKELKVRKKNIRREMFGSTQDITKDPKFPKNLTGTEIFTVTVNNDKKIQALSSETLLTSLERANIEVKNVSCRSGECSLCRLKLVSGDVFMPKGVLLRHADEKFSYIHSCKAYPTTDLEIRI